jgi:hypothetical protein
MNPVGKGDKPEQKPLEADRAVNRQWAGSREIIFSPVEGEVFS